MQWWVEFWNDWARTWGYDVWEWGNVAEWVGAIATVGALLGTAIIIAADRRRDRRRYANSVVTWVAADPYGGTPHATGRKPIVMIENTGTAPVLAAFVHHVDGSGTWSKYSATSPGSKHGSLVAGEAIELEIPDYNYGKHDRLFFKFIDADNQHWTRDATTGKYLRRDPSPYSSPLVRLKVQSEIWKSRYDNWRDERAAEKLSPTRSKKNPNKKTK